MRPDPQTDLEALLREEPHVRALAHILCAGHADEVVQQTWLHACEYRGKRVQQPRAWLSSIVRNVANNLLRRERRQRRRDQAVARPSHAPSSLEWLQREERRRELVQLVDALPTDLREVLVLRYFEGLPPRVIAEQLQLPVGTIWNRHRRAIDQLRQALDVAADNPQRSRSAWLLPLLAAPWFGPLPLAPVGTKTSALALPTGILTSTLSITMKWKLITATAVLLTVAIGLYWQQTALPQPPTQEAEASLPVRQEHGALVDQPQPSTNHANSVREAVAPPTTTPAGTGSLSVAVVFAGEDASPAHNITMRCRNVDEDPRRATLVRTDAQGLATFPELQPGPVYVWGDRYGPSQKATIVAGETTDLNFVLPDTSSVAGIVVDNHGLAIAGAAIMAPMPGLIGRDPDVLAISATDGTFTIRCAPQPCMIGARASGYLASDMQFAYAPRERETDVEPLPVRIELQPGGGSLAGSVVDPDGKPIANALVVIGDGEIQGIGGVTGKSQPPMPGIAYTEADGSFTVVGVKSGDVSVRVRARDYAPYRGTCLVTDYVTCDVRIMMQPGCVVRGTVTSMDGQPVAQADVHHGEWTEFERVATRTDQLGNYTLRDLPTGEVLLRAQDDRAGKAAVMTYLTAGATHEQALHLSRGNELRGTVTDQAGKPVANVRIQMHGKPDASRLYFLRHTKTDGNGHYSIPNCPEGQLLHVAFEHEEIPPRTVADYDLQQGPLNIVVQRETANATITGTVVDATGKPLADVTVRPRCQERGLFPDAVVTKADGTFVFAALPSGRWRISFDHATYIRPGMAPFRLAPDGNWDLGPVQLQAGGTAMVRSRRVRPSALSFMITSDATRQQWTMRGTEEHATTPLLVPGSYQLQVWGKRAAAQTVAFTIHSGQQTELELTSEVGVHQHLAFHYSKDAPRPYGATLTIHRDETLLVDTWLEAPKGEPWSYDLWLLPGTYRLAMHGVLKAATTLTIAAGTEPTTKIELR